MLDTGEGIIPLYQSNYHLVPKNERWGDILTHPLKHPEARAMEQVLFWGSAAMRALSTLKTKYSNSQPEKE